MDVIGVNNQFAVRAGVVSVAPALCQLRGAVLEPLTQTSTDGFAFFNDIHENQSFQKIKTAVTKITAACWVYELYT